MNTAMNKSTAQGRQAIKNIRDELDELYRKVIGKELDPEVLWAEAADFVARYGPDASLKEFF